MNAPGDFDRLAERLRQEAAATSPCIVGLTGSVASGKSTLAGQLVDALKPGLSARTVTTDGFLYPNAELERRELINRKGFPETYDRAGMQAALMALREGAADFPVYDHQIYDIHPEQTLRVEAPDILVLEGLGFSAPTKGERTVGEPDLLIYLHAEEALLERWFLERFMRFMDAAKTDETSFYRRFLHLKGEALEQFARSVWTDINLPNLREHIRPLIEHADLVLEKDAQHRVWIAEDRH